jgi:MFS family permease
MRRLLLLRPLRHQPFRLLFAGQVVSDLGDWLDLLALLTLIAFTWHLGAAALAALNLAFLLPWALLGPFAGVLADRWPRRTTMVCCDLGRALIVLGLLWAPSLPPLILLVILKNTLSTLFTPARQSAIRGTVPDGDLLAANALSRVSFQSSRVIGPGLGGLLVAAVGPCAAFGVDAATFLVSAVVLSRLSPLVAVTKPDGSPSRFWSEFRAGFGYIRRNRVLLLLVGAMMAEFLIVTGSDSVTVLIYKQVGMGAGLVGLAIGVSGLGNLGGSLLIGQWGQRTRPFAIFGSGMLLVAFTGVTLGLAALLGANAVPFAWLAVVALGGAGFAGIWTPYSFLLQRETAEAIMGRVSAAATGLCSAFGLLGPPLGAVLAGWWGAGALYAAAGGALGLLGAALLRVEPRSEPREPHHGRAPFAEER